MIEIEIDGKTVSSEPGKTVIEVADTIGIYIPRFCYHKKLSVAANCRMCLVEVEKSGKPLPACATPITGGMKVYTQSPKAIAAQRAVMEFLLINHPLDCPICDQGGECELQDLAMGYGRDASRYNQGKRAVHDKDLGPLVESCMTRCIQCTRCVRFGDEIAGLRELGAYNRGEHLEIGTYVQRAMVSELSGNVIDICPVGALTSKPFRYTARAWEMEQKPSIAPHDCVGSHIYVHTRGEILDPVRHVMRVVPRPNEAINEVWLSDRDRFSYEGLHSADRVMQPMMKQKAQWETTDWETALNAVAQQLQKIIRKAGGHAIAGLISPNATLEECYLLQKLLRDLGSHNIDHRLRQLDFSDEAQQPLYPQLGLPIADIEKLDTIVLIGANVRQEQPLLNHRIRKAVSQGAKVFCVDMLNHAYNFAVQQQCVVGSEAFVAMIAKITKALAQQSQDLPSIVPDQTAKIFAQGLQHEGKAAVFLGSAALHHPNASAIRALAQYMAKQINASVGELTTGANSAGAWIAGAVPHRGAAGNSVEKTGFNAVEMLEKPLSAYFLFGIEPELDCAKSQQIIEKLKQTNLTIAITTFVTPFMKQYADIILPLAPFTETDGTYINVEGSWQDFVAASPCAGEAKPGWKILQALGNLLKLEGFQYKAVAEIRQELYKACSTTVLPESQLALPKKIPTSSGLNRISEWPMYRVDSLVRRSAALQERMGAETASIRINSALAHQLQLQSGDKVTAEQDKSSVTLPVIIDEAIPDNNVFIPMGLQETAGFGVSFGTVELRKGRH